jgi:preprotein translocase subunit SecA
LVTQALVARELFHRNRQYVVQEGKVVIVDEFTGRLMPKRTWREGLHQAIEAKEGLEVTAPTEILARLSFQRYYRGYRRLSGMSGTVLESANELWQIYRLPVVAIPTNRPCVRVQLPDRSFADAESKWKAVVEEIATVHALNRPVLVGTRSVAASEALARRLGERGLGCEVLNAVRHAEEARIVARAGEFGRITIATNMAGRGTDILLGKGVAAIGGLHVIATEPNESGRVDRQLSGRAGRQGNPGSARRFFSMEDDLLLRFFPAAPRRQIAKRLGGGSGESRAVYARGAVRYAQFAAQWMAARQRAAVLRNDTWLEEALSFAGPDVGG